MAEIDELKQKFDSGNVTERLNAISSLLVLADINEAQAKGFVEANRDIIGSELRTLGFSLENPLIKFLIQYNISKKNIEPFLNKENWESLHNLYTKRIVNEKELDFSCSEIDKVKFLVNDHFWNEIKIIDREWYVKIWKWCATKEPQKQILNDFALILFSDITETDIKKLDNWDRVEGDLDWTDILKNIEIKLKNIDFTTLENADKLRKCLLFSDVLEKCSVQTRKIISIQSELYSTLDTYNKIEKDKIKYRNDDTGAINSINNYLEQYEKDIKKLTQEYANSLIDLIKSFNSSLNASNIYPESAPLLPTSTTNKIVLFLGEDANLSNRDVLGRYQTKDTFLDSEKTSDNNARDNDSFNNQYMNDREITNQLNKLGIKDVESWVNNLNRMYDKTGYLDNIINTFQNIKRRW